MKKLRLKIEELSVEQFHVQPNAVANRGTVRGLADTDAGCSGGCTEGACTGGCTQVGCSQACGASMNANTAPCFFCPRELDTSTCNDTSCC